MRGIILADGGPEVGGGHLSRCRSLACAARDMDMTVRWVVPTEVSSSMRNGDVFRAVESFSVSELEPALEQLYVDRGNLVIADGYRFSADALAWLGERYFLTVVDDYRHLPVERWASAVLNYNLGAENIPYGLGASLLLGPGYVPLRPSFRDASPRDDGFVFFVAGASDIAGATSGLVSWYGSDWPPVTVVVGPFVSGVMIDSIRETAADKPGLSVLVAPDNFEVLMARASAVVCTSSVTCYEALALNKPVVVFQVAENQRAIGMSLSDLGWGQSLGWWSDVSAKGLLGALERAVPPPPGCVPVDGARRAIEELSALAGLSQISTRRTGL
ncbi:MAG: hypothetical protein CSA35_04700 [Dethiosulfovibrio peptidovorans]|nr:MAG: hypothetical protein CSA35_04700 [Dethiosulfovibrio peptidovorans]